MYCSHCGQVVDAGQTACPGCGQAVVAPQPGRQPAWFAGQPAYGSARVQRHVQTLGILWLVYAGWTVATWLVALPFVAGLVGRWQGTLNPHGFFLLHHPGWLLPFITVWVVARAALSAIAGAGLLRQAPWGRTWALVAAFLTILKPITGTVLAIYTLWVLLPQRSGREYETLAVPVAPGCRSRGERGAGIA